MPIPNISQPSFLPVDDTLRLRAFDDHYDFALDWYQDGELVYLVDGKRQAYDLEKLCRMYHYLDRAGELYFIEALEGESFRPIGDVTLCREDLPIVIGDPAWRGRGVGGRVLAALIQRGRQLGFPRLAVGEIYDWNGPSRRCFQRAGFQAYEKTERGARYQMYLTPSSVPSAQEVPV